MGVFGRVELAIHPGGHPLFDSLKSHPPLVFDSEAARAYAEIAAARRAAGEPISQADCEIAAAARSRDAAIATRKLRDFEECGVEVIDPWGR